MTLPVAVGVYWLNLLLLGVTLAVSSAYLARGPFVDEDGIPKLRICQRRILVAQTAYGVAALICLLNCYASVAALAAVQLYFIVSPRIPGLDRLLQPGGDQVTRKHVNCGQATQARLPTGAHIVEMRGSGEYTTAEVGDLFGVATSIVDGAVERSKHAKNNAHAWRKRRTRLGRGDCRDSSVRRRS